MRKQNDNHLFPAEAHLDFSFPRWICAVWAFVIAAPLVPFPAPSALVGHPWKVELTTSIILAIFSFCVFLQKEKFAKHFAASNKIFTAVILPCCAFVLWSAASAFWAGSTLSVAHHTLVWSGYLIFFLFAANFVADKKLFKTAAFSLSAVVAVISATCVLEFTFSETVLEPFGFRYGRYAEIFAALLPLFFSFTLRLKGKNLILAASVTILLWLSILFTVSRSGLLASLAGLFVFVALRIFSKKNAHEKKRLAAATCGILLVGVLVQFPIFSSTENKASTLSRFTSEIDKSAENSISQNIRFLFYRVGFEMFRENPLTGVGADNFGLEFNKYRELVSARTENKSLAGQQDWRMPERTHNEYLQILTELGLIGAIIFSFFLFGVAKLGFSEIRKRKNDRYDILTHAAAAGIIAFLLSSFFSSFSFRLMQNGLVFFFLLAVLLRKHFRNQAKQEKTVFFFAPQTKLYFASISLALCLSLTIFSALKAASQFYVYQGERANQIEIAQSNFERAERLDPANAAANFSFGLRLLNEKRYAESAEHLRKAVDKGLNTTVSYSYLISAQTLANDLEQAEKTGLEAVRIFPYSVFMRVRFSSVLDRLHKQDESVKQYETARGLNIKHAETWRALINDGAFAAGEKAKTDRNIINLMELHPPNALYAVLAERELLYPEEKTKFNFRQ